MAMFDRYARFQAEVSKRTDQSGDPPANDADLQAERPASSSTANFAITIAGLDSIDLPGLTDEPDDPTNCCVEVNIALGTNDGHGADNLTMFFMTPRWLAEHPATGGWRVLEYAVVVDRFSFDVATTAVRDIIRRIAAPSWDDFVAVFSRYAYWEHSWETPPARP